jgi:hypothetical protein
MTPPRRKKGLLAALHTESFDLLLFIISETSSWALGSQVEETFGQEAREYRLCVCVFWPTAFETLLDGSDFWPVKGAGPFSTRNPKNGLHTLRDIDG